MIERNLWKIVLLAWVIGAVIFSAQLVVAQESMAPQTAAVNLTYGLRLQSDMLFYATIGAIAERADAGIGIGLNDSVWLGAHAYFYENEGLAAFTGLELHITYPPRETITLKPSLPIGFAITKGRTITTVAAVITPALAGEPINSVFAVSFQMEL